MKMYNNYNVRTLYNIRDATNIQINDMQKLKLNKYKINCLNITFSCTYVIICNHGQGSK